MSAPLAALVARVVLAHGVGGRRDLPVDVWLVAYASSAALVISFLLLRILWPRPRLAAAALGRALGAWAGVLRAAATVVLRAVGLVAFVVTVLALWFGTTNSADNLGPTMVYVLLWVGVAFASAVLGDVWSVLSPYDTIAGVAQWVRDRRWQPAPAAAPDDGRWFALWPAVVGLAGFEWLELCYHARGDTEPLALIVTAYSVVVLACAARFGRSWLRTGETFAALFGLFAAMAPLHRDRDGRVRLRWPFAGLATVESRTGRTALVLVALGGTTFDGVSRTTFWQKVLGTSVGWSATALNTVGLLWIIAIVAFAYAFAAYAAAWIAGADRVQAIAAYAPSLVPIAFAYAVAHYFSLLVFEGQAAYALVSDPFGRDWDLFGTATYVVSFTVISPATLSWIKVVAVVVGHVAGVTVAHDRAVGAHRDHRTAVRSQLPLLAVMVVYTVAALLLLLS